MQKKLLCAALLSGIALSQSVFAQDSFDDRWYLSGSVGPTLMDSDREVRNEWQGGVGLGKFFSPNLSLDAELKYVNPMREGSELLWSQYGLGLTARYHFRDAGATWWPYVAGGVGAWRHESEFSSFDGGRPRQLEGTNLEVHAGVGLQADLNDRFSMRTEVLARLDTDDESLAGQSGYTDLMANIGFTVKLGDVAAPVVPTPVEPEPVPVKTCADMDDDGDGVNNCDDKCPNSTAGQTIGPDGCPVPVTIDLRGVNFDFDKAALRPDAVAILNEAVSILKQYPDLKVEVAGHTDAKGTDAYNQKLSESRAKAVYDYLTSNGIDAARLAGPNGYGEARPIAPNTNADGSDNPEGRAQNRRTELNVQN